MIPIQSSTRSIEEKRPIAACAAMHATAAARRYGKWRAVWRRPRDASSSGKVLLIIRCNRFAGCHGGTHSSLTMAPNIHPNVDGEVAYAASTIEAC